MNISKMKFPEQSLLYTDKEKFDYYDTYGGSFSDKEENIGLDDLAMDFMKPLPCWIDVLMSLRNTIVLIVGLKKSNDKKLGKKSDNIQFIPGEKIGFFMVYDKTANELILGENDKHLNFRISLFLETLKNDPLSKTIFITTVVEYNNWLGPVYFFFVKPLHRLIVPAMMKKDYSHLKK